MRMTMMVMISMSRVAVMKMTVMMRMLEKIM